MVDDSPITTGDIEEWYIKQYGYETTVRHDTERVSIMIPDKDIFLSYDALEFLKDPRPFLSTQEESHKKYIDVMDDIVNLSMTDSRAVFDNEKAIEDSLTLSPDALLPIVKASIKSSLAYESFKHLKTPKRFLMHTLISYTYDNGALDYMKGLFSRCRDFYDEVKPISALAGKNVDDEMESSIHEIRESINTIVRKYDRVIRSGESAMKSTSHVLEMLYDD